MELTTLVTKIWECLPILTVLKKSPGATVFPELLSDAKPNIRGPEKKMIDSKNHKGRGGGS